MIYEKELSDKIIGCAIEVHKILGAGFLEKVYENALKVEFKLNNISCAFQYKIEVFYHDVIVGNYIIDLFVERKVVLELKSFSSIQPVHIAQLYNYLVATKQKVGYVLNFGNPHKLEFKCIAV